MPKAIFPRERLPSAKSKLRPELFFALVGAIGTDLDRVGDVLATSLSEMNYQCTTIRLSELVHHYSRWKRLPEAPFDKRIDTHMTAGNQLREALRNGGAMALLAILEIQNIRRQHYGVQVIPPKLRGKELDKTLRLSRILPIPQRAYILRSLKHTDEVRLLRRVYGPSFHLVGAYSPREIRLQNLTAKIAESRNSTRPEKVRDKAEWLNTRDEAEEEKEYGQNLRETYPMSDVFVDASQPTELEDSLRRFVELVFACGIHTPNKDEYAMFHAQAAAFRSADLSRQVGASIATSEGNIVSVGCNEVPKFGGGQYWSDDAKDNRDYRLGYSVSDKMRKSVLADTVISLAKARVLRPRSGLSIEAIVESVLPRMKDSQVMDLIEFGRAVHAEMAALLSAAHSGVSVNGCFLYSTTFPCQDCARHIVDAGVRKVAYIEPYPKSRTAELHPDSIQVDNPGHGSGHVDFVPFVGVAPRKYMQLFSMLKRKNSDGSVFVRSKVDAMPRHFRPYSSYVAEEFTELYEFSTVSKSL